MSGYLNQFSKILKTKIKDFYFALTLLSKNNVFWSKPFDPRGSDIILPDHF